MFEYMFEYMDEGHILQPEAVNCMAAVRCIVGPHHKGMTIMVHCDNSAAVCIFATGQGREPVILACAWALWRHAADVDCNLRFRHVPGERMEAADTLSRASLSPAYYGKALRIIQEKGLTLINPGYASFSYSDFL